MQPDIKQNRDLLLFKIIYVWITIFNYMKPTWILKNGIIEWFGSVNSN